MSVRFLLVTLFVCSQLVLAARAVEPPSARPLPASQLEFVPNRGQFRTASGSADTMLYAAYGRGTACYLSRTGIHYVQSVAEQQQRGLHLDSEVLRRDPQETDDPREANFEGVSMRQHRVDVYFVDANRNAKITEHDSTAGSLNYYLGKVRVEGVRAVRRVVYHDLYPHIDLVVYADVGGLKYDFVVHPGGDPHDIVMRYEGAESLSLTKDGGCKALTSLGSIEELRPYTYQEHAIKDRTSQQPVRSAFERHGNAVSFRIERYDRTRDLVIDPAIAWATYFGGTDEDMALCVRTDAKENVVLVGYTVSTNQIATPGAHDVTVAATDAFIAKFNSDGVRLWATYMGSTNIDHACGLAISDEGRIFIHGLTLSDNMATPGAQDEVFGGAFDFFVASFTTDGQLRWSTYLGGESYESYGFSQGMTLTSDGNVVVAGQTRSATGIATAGAHKTSLDATTGYDGMLVVYNQDGALQWATYVGGEGNDKIFAVSTDHTNKRIVVVGSTDGADGIATTGAHRGTAAGGEDGFVMSFDNDGVRKWGTYYGGDQYDNLFGVACGSDGSICATGNTASTTGIATAGAHRTNRLSTFDPFIIKLNYEGVLQWGTYYGSGALNEFALCAAYRDTTAYVSGYANGTTRFATAGAFQPALGGMTDVYLAAFAPNGQRMWGSYFGGEKQEIVRSLHVDEAHSIYLCGQTGSANNLSTAGAHQTNRSSTLDGFVVKICDLAKPLLALNSNDSLCAGEVVGVSVITGSHIIRWFDGANALTAFNDLKTYTTPTNLTQGSHKIWVEVGSGNCMSRSDTTILFVNALPAVVALNDTAVCKDGSLRLDVSVTSGSPPFSYVWSPSTLLDSPNLQRPLASPISPTTFYCVVTDAHGCKGKDSVFVDIRQYPAPAMADSFSICRGEVITIGDTVVVTPTNTYLWSPADGLNSVIVARPVASPLSSTFYHVSVTNIFGCTTQDSVFVGVRPDPVITMPDTVSICPATGITIGDTSTTARPYTYLWSPSDGLSSTVNMRPVASPSSPTVYHVVVTDASGCTTNDSVFVDIRSNPLPSIVPGGRLVLCGTDSITLKADAGFAAYRWNTGNTSSSIVIKNAGDYAVTVTDANGCKGTSDTVHVVASPLPTSSIVGPDAACLNGTNVYDVHGSTTDTYAWSLTSGGTIVSTTPPGRATVRWTSIGSWTLHVDVKNAEGCSSSSSIDVVVADSLQPTIAPAGPITLCKDASVVLHASKGYVSYTWSTGATADSIVVVTSGDYFVKVLGQGGCDGTSNKVSVTVIPDPPPSPSVVASDTVFCAGDSATIALTPATFTSYLWNTGATTPGIIVRAPGKYFASVVDAKGCSGNSDTIEIDVVALPDATITASGPTTFCKGGDVTLSAAAGPWTYAWTTGEMTRTIVASNSGTYGVRIRNAEGCESTSSVLVDVHDSPLATMNGPDAVCFSTTSRYTSASTGATKTWSIAPPALGTILTGQGTSAIDVQWGTTSGVARLTLLLTNAQGCSDTATLNVVIDAVLRPTINVSGETTFCDGDSVTLSIADGFLSYQWSDASGAIIGATARSLTVRQSGNYACTVSNASGCSGTSNTIATIVHPLPPQPIITYSGIVLTCTPASMYQWSVDGVEISGATSQTHPPTTAGTYTVTITDSNGCKATSAPYGFSTFPKATVAVGLVPRVEPNRTIEIPIELRNSSDLDVSGANKYKGRLRYNGTMILPTGSRGGTVTLPDQAVAGGTDRVVEFEGERGAITSGTLQWLQFVTLLGNDTCTTLELSEFGFTDADVDIQREHGEFCESGICITEGEVRLINTDARLALRSVHPNPARDAVAIAYELFEHGHTKLMLTNVLGRCVRTIVDEDLRQGSHQTSLILTDISPGWYQLILVTPTAVVNQLLIVGAR